MLQPPALHEVHKCSVSFFRGKYYFLVVIINWLQVLHPGSNLILAAKAQRLESEDYGVLILGSANDSLS